MPRAPFNRIIINCNDRRLDNMNVLKKLTYRAAVRAALREALESDSRVFLMSEDVGRYVELTPAVKVSWMSSGKSAFAIRPFPSRLSSVRG
jgi:hypothetical protein